jgi:hypothetical protein
MRLIPAITLSLMAGCSPGTTPDIPPIALSPTEYNNTIRDLLAMPEKASSWPAAPAVLERLAPPRGEQSGLFESAPVTIPPWPWPLPEEPGVDDFEGMVDGQSASAYQLEELQKAAIHYGAYTLVAPNFFTCEDWETLDTSAQEACAWASLERFAPRAWRRNLTDDEASRLQAFWEANRSQGELDVAIALTAAGILQSPHFLFRVEQGKNTKREKGRVRLTDWELASRLSYFLWDSLPDGELFAAAASGELSKPKEIRSQVQRMLQDPRAEEAVVHFHHQWLGTDTLGGISPARHVYGPVYGIDPYPPLDTTGDGDWPAVLGPIRHSMEAETHLFIASTLFSGAGTLEALLTDNHGYQSSHTAPLYGDDTTPIGGETIDWRYGNVVNSQAAGGTITLEPVTYPSDQRAGLLTLPAVLALGAHSVHPSPILRGKRVLERVTCTELGSPPAAAEGTRPPDTLDAESTNRERIAAVTSPTGCAACHDRINPAGFAFENYDSMGGWRDSDNDQPVDASGSLALDEETLEFANGVELSHLLATNAQVHDCYARRWTDYAIGATLDETDPEVQRIQRDFRKDDNVLKLLEDIATSEIFRFRALGGEQ